MNKENFAFDNRKLNRYWTCTIGPVIKSRIPDGGDGPLRGAVKRKFIEMFDENAEICSSGWGVTEEMKQRLDSISLLPITDSSGEILKQIDELLSEQHNL